MLVKYRCSRGDPDEIASHFRCVDFSEPRQMAVLSETWPKFSKIICHGFLDHVSQSDGTTLLGMLIRLLEPSGRMVFDIARTAYDPIDQSVPYMPGWKRRVRVPTGEELRIRHLIEPDATETSSALWRMKPFSTTSSSYLHHSGCRLPSLTRSVWIEQQTLSTGSFCPGQLLSSKRAPAASAAPKRKSYPGTATTSVSSKCRPYVA